MSREEVVTVWAPLRNQAQRVFSKLSGDSAKDSTLIGAIGVGFYSAFIVAEKVVVHTRRQGCLQMNLFYGSLMVKLGSVYKSQKKRAGAQKLLCI